MVIEELAQALSAACQKLFATKIKPQITRPDEQFGDFATNLALQLAKKAAASPRQIAAQLVEELQKLAIIEDISIAGPGFINFKLTNEALAHAAFSAADLPRPLTGQQILVEFGDPNPFKQMHIGHLYGYIVGESICRLLETSGASLERLSYHGDVGLHVAKAIYGLRQLPAQAGLNHQTIEPEDYLGQAYSLGAAKYENDPTAKAEIDKINIQIYQKDDPIINQLHQQGIKLSFKYFDKILDFLSIATDKRYLESQTIEPGLKKVTDNVGSVFKRSQGAIIYDGQQAGLHIRVFITSQGLPTYETKDLGLTELKHSDFPKAQRSIIITANEQSDYFRVMLAALAQIEPKLAHMTTHLPHGFLSLSSGKMSSRSGNVYTAMKLLELVKQAVHEQYPDSPVQQPTSLAAVKYSFLKHRLGSDIVFDVKESISLEGNSGPYLLYAHARAASILTKSNLQALQPKSENFDQTERSLARRISEYPEVVSKAVNELMPHHICGYLYELAQAFNSFYETSRIIGDQREATRLQLVSAFQQVLQSGLDCLNITAPEKM